MIRKNEKALIPSILVILFLSLFCSKPVYQGDGVQCSGGEWTNVSTTGPGPVSSIEKDLESVINSYLGTPYQYGGNSHSGIDCSGLTQQVFSEIGVNIPRTASSQASAAQAVQPGNLRFGDLLFFNTSGGSVSHVGIYLGNGIFVHSSSSKGVVREMLGHPYYATRLIGAGRVL